MYISFYALFLEHVSDYGRSVMVGTILHFRYPIVCTVGKAKKAVRISWITTIALCVASNVTWEFYFNFDDSMSMVITSYVRSAVL